MSRPPRGCPVVANVSFDEGANSGHGGCIWDAVHTPSFIVACFMFVLLSLVQVHVCSALCMLA